MFHGQVHIKKVMQQLADIREELDVKERPDRKNLRIDLAGFALKNPFILDAPDASDTLEKCLNALRAGYGGVILPHKIQEHTAGEGYISPRFGSVKMGRSIIELIDIDAEACSFSDSKDGGADEYPSGMAAEGGSYLPESLGFIPVLKRTCPENMVIASYRKSTGIRPADYSILAEKAGADALLLDFTPGTRSALQQLDEIKDCLRAVREKSSIPLILRFQASDADQTELLALAEEYDVSVLNPQYSGKGILSVNQHYYAPEPSVRGKSAIGLTRGLNMKPTALAQQAILAKNKSSEKLQFLSGTGIECWSDGLDFILLGASAVCVSEAVMHYGLRVIDDLTDGLSGYLAEKNLNGIQRLIGIALANITDAEELDSNAIMYPNISRTKCIRCGRCSLVCKECSTGALTTDFGSVPMLIARNCTGCHLCIQNCPTGALTPTRRINA